MKLCKLLYNGEYTAPSDVANIEIDNIATDAKDIRENTLFVLIKSISFDINNIIDYVLSKNPAAIICESDVAIESQSIPILRTENTRRLLSYIYARFHGVDFKKTSFIAITGTNGKTTTATMLTHILTNSNKKVGFIGTGKITVNGRCITDSRYSMTTPDPSSLYSAIKEMQDEKCEFIVMEVSSHALYFQKCAPIPFKISVFTNLSPEHLDFHKTTEAYYKTKLTLFLQTELGIFNMDDTYSARAFMEVPCKKTCIGILRDADAMARDVALNGISGSEYIYREPNRLFKVRLKIGGAYNIYNSMLAIAAAIALGIKPCEAKAAIGSLDFIDGRLEIIRDEVTVIIDYAHTEAAITNVLKTIKSTIIPGQKLYTVFGCGGNRDREKRPLMARAAEKYSDLVIVTTDNSREEPESDIIKDILAGFENSECRKVITSRAAAIEHAILMAEQGDIIAVIGKGHERYNIDKNGYHDFDERDIIAAALKKRKERSESIK